MLIIFLNQCVAVETEMLMALFTFDVVYSSTLFDIKILALRTHAIIISYSAHNLSECLSKLRSINREIIFVQLICYLRFKDPPALLSILEVVVPFDQFQACPAKEFATLRTGHLVATLNF
jgi:hypothetical protein